MCVGGGAGGGGGGGFAEACGSDKSKGPRKKLEECGIGKSSGALLWRVDAACEDGIVAIEEQSATAEKLSFTSISEDQGAMPRLASSCCCCKWPER